MVSLVFIQLLEQTHSCLVTLCINSRSRSSLGLGTIFILILNIKKNEALKGQVTSAIVALLLGGRTLTFTIKSPCHQPSCCTALLISSLLIGYWVL